MHQKLESLGRGIQSEPIRVVDSVRYVVLLTPTRAINIEVVLDDLV